MAFYDVERINYERLTRITQTEAPYKNSGNAYPLGNRKYSDRHFRKEDDGSFSIWMSDRETTDAINGAKNDKANRAELHRQWYENQKLGVVRPDNSFEFLARTSQGENMMMCNLLNAYVHHNASLGGTIYQRGSLGNAELMHPVFKGLRINCDTGEAMTPYETYMRKVRAKDAKEVMQEYQEFLNVFPVMLQSMDEKGIWEVYTDMYHREAKDNKDEWRSLGMPEVHRMVKDKHYVDAACLFVMSGSRLFSNMRWQVEYLAEGHSSAYSRLHHNWAERAIANVKKDFRRHILKQHPDVFDLVQIPVGKVLPTSQWGLIVKQGGEPVARL